MPAKLIQFLQVVIWVALPVTILSNECFSTEKCTCIQSNEYYEYYCPPGDFEMNIIVLPEKHVNIRCESSSLDLDKLPNINAGNVSYFSMSYCPLLSKSFSTILNKFNTYHTKTLVFESTNSENIKITKHAFKNLDELESLTIQYSTMTLEDDFLVNTPNLLELGLPTNNINEIGYIFNYTSQLNYLDLSRNNLRKLPKKVFYNLHQLQRLHLSRNNLKTLNKEMFTGLKKLKLLELSMNRVSTVSEDAFSELKNLITISLRNNELGYIAGGLFQRNLALESVHIGNNQNLQLSDYTFANLTSLKHVNIDESNLTDIPEHLFESSLNLEEISISRNKLKNLPENLLQNMRFLKKIDLSCNQLNNLPDSIFDTLRSLTELFLQNNFIETINNHIFENLSNLRFLNLEQNKIAVIDNKAFVHLRKLKAINLAHNRWNYSLPKREDQKLSKKLAMVLEYYYSPLNACLDLEEINLSSNFITDFPADIVQWKTNLKKLNLASNFISTITITDFIGVSYDIRVDLSKNNLTRIDFSSAERLIELNSGVIDDANIHIILDYNTIYCDCLLYDLFCYNNRMMNPIMHKIVEISQKDFNCINLQQVPVIEINPNNLSCTAERDMGCPKHCECRWKPYDQSVVIDCSYKNLSEAPVISSNIFDNIYLKYGFVYNKTVVNLEGNKLVTGPEEGLGYENLTELSLINNQLTGLTWVPPNIEVLQVDDNKIEVLNEDIIAVLENTTSLKRLSLSNNPWKCDCSASRLQRFLMRHYKKVVSTDVICFATGEPLVNTENMCRAHTGLPTILFVLFFVVVLVLMLVIYYMYAKKLLSWILTGKDLDQKKSYDVFICYSHKDKHFVVDELLPVLEGGPRPYKTCIHARDWAPGERTTTQILNSVQDAKRTMIIVSNNFAKSDWGLMEFRTAHRQAMKDGRARVIIVVYGDLDEDLFNNELKSYLKTNTYVKWGEPWFWQKIRYALPHPMRTY